jgi:FkbM family methyltransferase
MVKRPRLLRQFDSFTQKLRNAMVIDRRELHAIWEQHQLRQLFDFLNVDCVFDIGANVGQYAHMLRQEVGYRGWIFSFEPIPTAAAKLRERAGGDPKWIIIECAVADYNGTRTFNVMRHSQFSSLAQPRHEDVRVFVGRNEAVRTVEVATVTLESAFAEVEQKADFSRPFLKMDTQGFDLIIARASPQTMPRFLGLQSELAVARLYDSSADFRESLTAYEEMGFTLTSLVPNNAGNFPRLLEIDCIMIRSDLLPEHLQIAVT